MPEGTFVLADIGGYTQFLTGVGLEHGKEITSHLLNSLLKCNRGRWKVANVEGDCLFFYREGREPPDELLDHVRALFEDFCDRTTDIAARASCPCGACSRTNELALKFIVDSGEFDTQRIGDRDELIGPEVVVAHRLLKNGVPLVEYVLATASYLAGARVPGLPAREGRDEYEGIGAVDYVFFDLAPARAEVETKRQFFLTPSEARVAVTQEIEAPADVIWGAMMDLEKRKQWQVTVKEMDGLGGKQGRVGEVHRCVHDDGSRIVHVTVAIDEAGHRRTEKIWFSRLVKDAYLTEETQPLPGGRCRAGLYATYRPTIPVVSHLVLPLMMLMMTRSVRKDMEGLKAYCESAAARATGASPAQDA